ncbi:MAG TPA: adenosylcobinamide-GDP ribazoletransferase [Candidatus Saccharimonadales bacterium]|nr:adenosylcobinamide-GDP ribazoletransferase [Candidatus Saccharimonadales bacterium]
MKDKSTILRQAKRQLDTALAGWVYFTRVPLPSQISKHIDYERQSLAQSAKYLPLIGIAVGSAAGSVYWLAFQALGSYELAVLLGLVAATAMTGAFHEDGLADFFDAFGNGFMPKEQVLRIMKDSRIGTYGSLALLLSVLLKYQSLLSLTTTLIVPTLIAGHSFSRFAAGSFIFTDRYVRDNDESHFKPLLKDAMHGSDFVVMASLGIVPIALLGHWQYVLLVPFLWLLRCLFGNWFTRKIGGYTGDCLGATQQVIEVGFYLGVIAITKAFGL